MKKDKKELKKITIIPPTDGEILIVTAGDLKHHIIPTDSQLKEIERMVKKVLDSNESPMIIFVPPYVKFKKIKFGKKRKLRSMV